MNKKITFTPKPHSSTPANADAWVNSENIPETVTEKAPDQPAPVKMKRFTFDVSESLHRRVKMRCAEKGVDIADEMRRLLEQHFPPA